MAKVYAPNKEYTGISASVAFANGVGETDSPTLLYWFRKHGYTVQETAKIPDENQSMETDQEKEPMGNSGQAAEKTSKKGK